MARSFPSKVLPNSTDWFANFQGHIIHDGQVARIKKCFQTNLALITGCLSNSAES